MHRQRQAQRYIARWALSLTRCCTRCSRRSLSLCHGPLPFDARTERRLVHCTAPSFSSAPQLSPSLTAKDPLPSHTTDLKPDYSHQRGYGKIVAVSSQASHSSPISTFLTDLRHSSPMRLVPSRRSHPTHQEKQHRSKYEAALLHLSSYGGGLVPGDSLHLDIDVGGSGTIVCILTQGGQRIYRPGEHFREHDKYNYDKAAAVPMNVNRERSKRNTSLTLCQSTIKCTVEPGGTLLYLPDPTVPYYQSSFQERREFTSQHAPESISIGDSDSTEIPSSLMGSIIAVDWYSSGRRFSTGMKDERWSFDYLATRTEFFITEKDQSRPSDQDQRPTPDLIESMVFDNASSEANNGKRTPAAIALGENLDAMTTMLLHGPTSLPVVKRAKSLSHHLAGLCTRTRSEHAFGDELDADCNEVDDEELDTLAKSLGGKLIMSITPMSSGKTSHIGNQPHTHLVRILADSNEDVYRVLHHCLKPCSLYLGGFEPYKDRIHSSTTVSGKSGLQNIDMNGSGNANRTEITKPQSSRQTKRDMHAIANDLVFGEHHNDIMFCKEAWFRLCTLSDSSLPVGSFAHSLGTEAASQMGLFTAKENGNAQGNGGNLWSASDSPPSCSAEALSDYIDSVSRSNARFSTPLILAGYSLLASSLPTLATSSRAMDANYVHQSWLDIDAYTNALLLSNDPGRRASIDQGLGLLRIAPSFEETGDMVTPRQETAELWELIRQSTDCHSANGHAAPIYGILSASLGIPPLDACRVFAFGAARDTVSAAVRLNLIGPMEGLSVLDGVGRIAVEKGLEEGLIGMMMGSPDGEEKERLNHWLRSAATCSPVMDTVHPLHDLLSVRLFRT